jgi:hypothetical protein
MFSSSRPDFSSDPLLHEAQTSFDMLVSNVEALHGRNAYHDEKAMQDVMATWAVTHGLADLLSSGRMKFLTNLPRAERAQILSEIIVRIVSTAAPVKS